MSTLDMHPGIEPLLTRALREDDVEELRELELRAARRFAALGMREIADDDPRTRAALLAYQSAGMAWVATVDGTCAGYLLAEELDDALHIAQVSVDETFAGRRIGAALIEHAASGRQRVTLTPFRDVPFNAPYYARLGFTVVPDRELGPQLRERISREAWEIPGDASRVAMVRERAGQACSR